MNGLTSASRGAGGVIAGVSVAPTGVGVDFLVAASQFMIALNGLTLDGIVPDGKHGSNISVGQQLITRLNIQGSTETFTTKAATITVSAPPFASAVSVASHNVSAISYIDFLSEHIKNLSLSV